jgi:hypothetical protein
LRLTADRQIVGGGLRSGQFRLLLWLGAVYADEDRQPLVIEAGEADE